MSSRKKNSRNAICTCGSGKKYKHCCLNSKDMPSAKIGELDLCSIIKIGLSNMNSLVKEQTENYKVKSVTFIDNQTICCQYYTDRSSSMDIKIEMYPIMVFITALVKDNDQITCTINQIAVRAFDSNDNEKMYAISRLQSIRSDGEEPIEWLKSTYFQENTDDYRLGVAKQKISTIENALRKIITTELMANHGNSWWNNCVTGNIRTPAEDMYKNKYGIVPTDGQILLEYTFLLQLKKIIVNNWKDFSNVFTKMNQNQLSALIDQVNEIRRDEGHNRAISDRALKELTKLYNGIIEPIALKHPAIVPKYLSDNWMLQLRPILTNHPAIIHFKNFNLTNNIKDLPAHVEFLLKAIEYLNDLEKQLILITPPPGKIDLHNNIVDVFAKIRQTYEQMNEHLKNGDIDEFEKAANLNKKAFANLTQVKNEILLSEG